MYKQVILAFIVMYNNQVLQARHNQGLGPNNMINYIYTNHGKE